MGAGMVGDSVGAMLCRYLFRAMGGRMDMRTPLHSVDAKVTELRWRHHPSKGLQGCEPGAAAGVGAAFVSLYRQLAGHLVEAVQRDAITERVLMQVHLHTCYVRAIAVVLTLRGMCV